MSYRPGTKVLMSVLAVLLISIGVFMIYMLLKSPSPEAQKTAVIAEQYLPLPGTPKTQGFSFKDIPSWLFVHVAAIAALQIISVISAAVRSSREHLTRADVATVQFLVEIPMYLGLFGTLLGVCLTQFITGSLVAPLAYLTTMSGILLHVTGKLGILLPLRIDQRVAE